MLGSLISFMQLFLPQDFHKFQVSSCILEKRNSKFLLIQYTLNHTQALKIKEKDQVPKLPLISFFFFFFNGNSHFTTCSYLYDGRMKTPSKYSASRLRYRFKFSSCSMSTLRMKQKIILAVTFRIQGWILKISKSQKYLNIYALLKGKDLCR